MKNFFLFFLFCGFRICRCSFKEEINLSFVVVLIKHELEIWFVSLWRHKNGSRLLAVLLAALGLLGEKNSVDVGENTSLGDGGAVKKLVQLLVVADGQLDVAGDDAGLLVVTSGVSGQLENLSGQVLDDGGEVDGGASSDAASVASLLQEAVDASDGELQTGLLGTGLGGGFLSGASGALSSFSRHVDVDCCCR